MSDKADLMKMAPGGHGMALKWILSLTLLFLLITGSGCTILAGKLMPPQSALPIMTIPITPPVPVTSATLSIGIEGKGVVRVINPSLQPTTIPTTITPTMAIPIPPPAKPPIGLRFNQAYNLTQKLTYGQVIKAHFIPYRFQFRNYYTAWDYTEDKWLNVTPPPGNRWLFVFINSHEDDDWRNITPVDGWGPKSFIIQWQNQIIKPGEEDRLIYQVMDESNLFKNSYQVPYGYLWKEDPELRIRHAIPIPRLVPGKSNSWDGYIIYAIPKAAEPEDIYLIGDFLWGSAVWRFEGGDIFSL